MAYLLGRLDTVTSVAMTFCHLILKSLSQSSFTLHLILLSLSAAYGSFSLVEVFTDKLISWYD